jgi:hypothetical protein
LKSLSKKDRSNILGDTSYGSDSSGVLGGNQLVGQEPVRKPTIGARLGSSGSTSSTRRDKDDLDLDSLLR